MAECSLVMEGSLGGGTSLDEVLSVVGISRQWMEVVLRDEAVARGRILCKGGQVVAAFDAPDRSGVDAFVSLYRRPTRTFEVYQRAAPAERIEPIGALADLIAHAQATPAAQDVVLEGTFADFGVREVLDVLSIGRQVLELVAARADGSRVILATKSGRVLSCEEPERGRSGVAAFRSLLVEPGERFRVTRREVEVPAEPLGTVAELVALEEESAERQRSVLLEGRFADTPLHEVIDVVGLTRQLVELVLREDTRTLGAVLIKAGRVLDARSARTGASGREAFVELVRDPGTGFSIVRRADAGGREPIGRLAELVAVAVTPPPAAPVLQGRFGETRITDLLDSVGPSRQRMEIRLSRGGRPLGRILLQAGQLLDVEHGGLRGQKAFRAILADPGTLYRVARHDGEVRTEPLGTLAEWMGPAPAPVREIVLEGTFADASIAEVLGTFSLTRQHVVALFRAGGKTRGRLALKAGRVLEVEHRGQRGVAAFRSLLLDPGEGFVVYRVPPGTPVPEPLGRLVDLLAASPASDEDDAPPTIVMGGSVAEESPTMVALLPVPAAVAAPAVAATTPVAPAAEPAPASIDARLRELSAAIAALEALAASRAPTEPAWTDRAFLLSLAISQVATLVVAGLLLARVLLGG